MNGTACKWCGRDFSGTSATCPYCDNGRKYYTLETRDPQAVVMLGNLNARIATLEEENASLRARVGDLLGLLVDCWEQFAVVPRPEHPQWKHDSCLSTLEDVLDELRAAGLVEQHPSGMDWWRVRAAEAREVEP